MQSNLKQSTNGLNRAIERMTTGCKINRAKDNAAGYSINTNMTTKISAYGVAENNVSAGLDLLTTASDSLSLISNHMERIRDLATQASNGTYGGNSLQAINSEVNARLDEVARLYNTTEYNGLKLFESGSGAFIQEVVKRDTSTMTTLASVDETTTISSGTYSISTAEELAKLATMTDNGKIGSGAEFVLANDIDLSAYSTGEGWAPIGISYHQRFEATLDGNGYVVKNLYINRPGAGYQGLFGYTDSATIKNVGLENADVTGNSYVGGLVGEADSSTIENSYATGSVTGNSYVGGLVGGAYSSTIANSYYDIEKSGQSDTGKGVGLSTAEIQEKMAAAGMLNAPAGGGSNSIAFQVGIHSNTESQISIDMAFALTDLERLRNIGLSGDNYLETIDNILASISAKQTEYGSAQNRLMSALEEINTHYENLVSSRSTLRDADIAEESSAYIRNQILQQAAATLLATANQSPSIALQLL